MFAEAMKNPAKMQELYKNTSAKIDQLNEIVQTASRSFVEVTQSLDEIEKTGNLKFPKEVSLPCLENFFIRGTKKDANTFLVDIGTGYFVEKSIEKTKEYIRRKIFILEKIVNTNKKDLNDLMLIKSEIEKEYQKLTSKVR